MQQQDQSGHEPALDGYRAIAVIAVMLYHTHLPAFAAGWAGVGLFFGLSGYLITGILLRAKGSGHYFKVFYARRALRIFPLYYLVLGVGLCSGLVMGWSVADWPWYAAYLQNYILGAQAWGVDFPDPWDHTWSLAVEEQFYLVAPLVVHMLPVRMLVRVFALAVLGSLLFKVVWLWQAGPSVAVYTHTLSQMDAICAGCWLACVRYAQPDMRWRRAMVLCLIGAILLWALVAWASPQVGSPWSDFKPGDHTWLGVHAFIVVLGPVVIHLLSARDGWEPLRRCLSATALVAIGRISYGLYLYHWIVFRAVDMLAYHYQVPEHHALTWLLRFGLTFGLAAASWRWFESPILRLKSRITYSA